MVEVGLLHSRFGISVKNQVKYDQPYLYYELMEKSTTFMQDMVSGGTWGVATPRDLTDPRRASDDSCQLRSSFSTKYGLWPMGYEGASPILKDRFWFY